MVYSIREGWRDGMGRTISSERKSEFLKFRVKPLLKQEIEEFMSSGEYRDLDLGQFLVILIRVGFSLKIETAKCQKKILAWMADHDPKEELESMPKKTANAKSSTSQKRGND
jgi:hypothetical protein